MTLDAIGLVLDVFGFAVLFMLARPALMRRDFVGAERVAFGSGVTPSHEDLEHLGKPEEAAEVRKRRRGWQTTGYYVGGIAVVLGFALQAWAALTAGPK